MGKHVNHMSYASNLGLVRMHCGGCNEETLHKAGACVHCGGRVQVTKRKRIGWNEADARNLAIRRARKAGMKAIKRSAA
jgi:hypothetical protein